MIKQWLIPWLAVFSFATAQETTPVEDAIPAAVKALPAPRPVDFPNGLRFAVTASSDTAQEAVLQGLNHLHSGWEFEASRHFAVAMREDPECLLAHWGMVIALIAPTPETGPARNAAVNRLIDLVDQGKGNDLERGYAYGILQYLREGSTSSATAFRRVAEKFPNDLQASIFAALFGRGGYDEFGDATPDQERSERELLALIEKHPDNPIPLHALLLIRAEAPDLTSSVEMARKLAEISPGYAPYHHLLGHYEWRIGEHSKAASAFGRAVTLFDRWARENEVPVADSPERIKSEAYRIVALASKGDFDTAQAAADKLAATPFPADRISSPGGRILLWEAKTLPARLLIHRGGPGTTAQAIESLPAPADLEQTISSSLANWWIDGLRLYLDSKRLLEENKIQQAMESSAVLSQHGQRMASLQTDAAQHGERSSWLRSYRSLEALASDLNGRAALAGPKSAHGSAYNWFRSATDRQTRATLLYPPSLLGPMANRLGEYYLAMNRPKDAVDAYLEALADYPNDREALKGLQRSYELADMPDKASETAKTIETLEEEQ